MKQMPGNYYYAGDMTNTKRRTVKTAAWALVALAVLGLVWYFVKGPGGPSEREYDRYLPKLSRASEAKLPSGFPIYYVLGASPEVTKGSQALNTNSNVRVYRVETKVASDPRAVFDEYVEFFSETGWLIRAKYLGSSAGSITAEKERTTVVVTFTASGRATIVKIEYQVPNATAPASGAGS